MKCPVDPYFIIPDKCVCVDFQTLRLQESPDAVPHGEMPRHMQLYCDRYCPSLSITQHKACKENCSPTYLFILKHLKLIVHFEMTSLHQ